jgi:hypothetical protein
MGVGHVKSGGVRTSSGELVMLHGPVSMTERLANGKGIMERGWGPLEPFPPVLLGIDIVAKAVAATFTINNLLTVKGYHQLTAVQYWMDSASNGSQLVDVLIGSDNLTDQEAVRRDVHASGRGGIPLGFGITNLFQRVVVNLEVRRMLSYYKSVFQNSAGGTRIMSVQFELRRM